MAAEGVSHLRGRQRPKEEVEESLAQGRGIMEGCPPSQFTDSVEDKPFNACVVFFK